MYTRDFHANDQEQNQDDSVGMFVWQRMDQVHCKSDPSWCLALGTQGMDINKGGSRCVIGGNIIRVIRGRIPREECVMRERHSPNMMPPTGTNRWYISMFSNTMLYLCSESSMTRTLVRLPMMRCT